MMTAAYLLIAWNPDLKRFEMPLLREKKNFHRQLAAIEVPIRNLFS